MAVLLLERKHVQNLCVNREKGTEKKAEPEQTCKALAGYPSHHEEMGRDVPAHGAGNWWELSSGWPNTSLPGADLPALLHIFQHDFLDSPSAFIPTFLHVPSLPAYRTLLTNLSELHRFLHNTKHFNNLSNFLEQAVLRALRLVVRLPSTSTVLCPSLTKASGPSWPTKSPKCSLGARTGALKRKRWLNSSPIQCEGQQTARAASAQSQVSRPGAHSRLVEWDGPRSQCKSQPCRRDPVCAGHQCLLPVCGTAQRRGSDGFKPCDV